MPATMTTHERFTRMFERKDTDRVPMWDFPWPGTLRRWADEGMPPGAEYEDYFGTDKVGKIAVDNSPGYPERVIEESDRYIISSTKWGGIVREFKNLDSTPDFLEFAVTGPEKWEEAKKNVTASPDRVPWDFLKKNYPLWRGEGRWLIGYTFFGLENIASYFVGTERLLVSLLDEPEWAYDMSSHLLDVNLKLLDMVWDAGYHFDMLNVLNDMGYKNTQFFSLGIYKKLVAPLMEKAVGWAHGKGIRIRLHSCGNITPFIPEIVGGGFDLLHPMEVKAGMDPEKIKREHGDEIALHGGMNAMLWSNLDLVRADMEHMLPILKRGGGYIFAADHSIPNDVSFENMKEIIRLAKELGKY